MTWLIAFKLVGAAGVLGPLINAGMGVLKAYVMPQLSGWQAVGVQGLITAGLAAAGTALGLSPVDLSPVAAGVVAAVPMAVSSMSFQVAKDWGKSTATGAREVGWFKE